MTDLNHLLRQTDGVSARAKLAAGSGSVGTAGEVASSANIFGRFAQWLERTMSPEARQQHRAGVDAYVQAVKGVNQELGAIAETGLQQTRQEGKPLTVRAVRELAARDLVHAVERQATELRRSLIERGVAAGVRPWSGSAQDEASLHQVRQSLELVLAHLADAPDSEASVRLQSLARSLDQIRGRNPGEWIVPASRLQPKGQQLVEVFNPDAGAMVRTTVTKSQLDTLLAARNEGLAGKTADEVTQLRRTAMTVIKATDQHKGLRLLERAPTDALVDLAYQIRFGVYSEFDELHEAQAALDERSLDQESLRLLQQYNSARGDFASKVSFEAQPAVVDLAPNRDDPVANARREVKDLRGLYAECLSPFNPVEIDTLPPEARLRKACLAHPEVFLDLIEHQDLREDPALSEVSPQVIQALIGLAGGMETAMAVMQSPSREAKLQVLQNKLLAAPTTAYQGLDVALNASMQSMEPAITGVMSQLSDEIERVGGNMGRYLGKAFKRYYAEQTPNDQKAMLAAYMRSAVPQSSDAQRLGALIKGAGPYVIKMLQMLGDRLGDTGVQKEMKDALGFVKTGLPSIHPDIRNAMLAAVMSDSNGQITGLRSVRSLGAASVGETFLTNVQKADGSSEQVVIKLLRPGIAERAARERRFMAEVAQTVPGMAGTFAGIADQIEAEMDLRSEAANVGLGQIYDDIGNPDVRTMKLAQGLQQVQRPFYMILEKAPGSTVSHYMKMTGNSMSSDRLEVHPVTLATRLGALTMDLAEKWVEEALFGSGFFHGDLHAGNLMFKANEGGPNGTLTVIDFGNSKVLNPHERQAIFKMMLTATLKDAPAFCTHFETILSPDAKALMTDEVRARFIEQITEVMRVKGDTPGAAIADILEKANELYIEVPGPIANFSRSELMLENALNELTRINADTWAHYQEKVGDLDREIGKRQRTYDRWLAASISDLEKSPSPDAALMNELKAMQGVPFLELSDQQIDLLRKQPDPAQFLVGRLQQIYQIQRDNFDAVGPKAFSIERAITNVLMRHRSEAMRLSGAELGLRAVRQAV